MKSLQYLVFGIPTNVDEAMDKLVKDEPEKVKILLEQVPPGNMRVKLNAKYVITTKFNGGISFNQTISNSYRRDSMYMGDSIEFQKAVRYLKGQVDTLKEKGVKVTVYVPKLGKKLSEEDFKIILKG